jgi:hypothetical protein
MGVERSLSSSENIFPKEYCGVKIKNNGMNNTIFILPSWAFIIF